ncbi:MAG TPA: thioesterase family protein [Solirubrobacterales bacterium]|nr:thioesterase family protein [Solirubrobacterales bacterium]
MSGAGGIALPGFDSDTALEELGDGRFAAEMSERWWVGRGPNGGYVAATILRAIEATEGGRAPRSLTVHFLAAPRTGPVEVAVTVERRGSRATFLSARLTQEGETRATALAVLSENWGSTGFAELEMPDAGEPGEMHAIDPSTRSGRPNMLQNYLVRPALGMKAFSGGEARNGAWIRTREPRLLDAPLAAAMLDTWFPAPFVKLDGPRLAPTIDYTVHFRSPLPPVGATPEDPYLISFRSGLVRHGFFEEDGELWSADGTLLAQSRQLALLLDPPAAESGGDGA